jgi:hypothetical protein
MILTHLILSDITPGDVAIPLHHFNFSLAVVPVVLFLYFRLMWAGNSCPSELTVSQVHAYLYSCL